MRAFFLQPFEDVMSCLEHIMSRANSPTVLLPMIISMVVSWFVYVPIHELLHARACVLTGGSISVLEISPRYGGAILAGYFDFVVAGGQYAGRLSGFDTHGSDLVYLATDFGPYVLSVLFGVVLLKVCAAKRRPVLFGTAVVVGLAPFYNIPGDYFEMGSIITTRVITWMHGGGTQLVFEGMRSDDVFTLISMIITQAAAMGSDGFAAGLILICVVLISLSVDVLLAFTTYALGGLIAGIVVPASRNHPPAAVQGPNTGQRRPQAVKSATSRTNP